MSCNILLAKRTYSLHVAHVFLVVRFARYATVGAALLDTLEKGLGAGWDEAHKEAWTIVYTVLSTTMLEAGEEKKTDA